MLGALSYAVAKVVGIATPLAVAGDVFFLTFLCMAWALILRSGSEDLDRRASYEDEGAAVVFVIAIAAIALSSIDIFSALNQKPRPDAISLALALAAAPLGWTMLHTIEAFHYANLYYRDPAPGAPPEPLALKFPETERPGPWDFVYFSFIIGMTAQVSDVVVASTPMRRVVIAHSVLSFFFNTVLIAMAVNVAVAVFQAG